MNVLNTDGKRVTLLYREGFCCLRNHRRNPYYKNKTKTSDLHDEIVLDIAKTIVFSEVLLIKSSCLLKLPVWFLLDHSLCVAILTVLQYFKDSYAQASLRKANCFVFSRFSSSTVKQKVSGAWGHYSVILSLDKRCCRTVACYVPQYSRTPLTQKSYWAWRNTFRLSRALDCLSERESTVVWSAHTLLGATSRTDFCSQFQMPLKRLFGFRRQSTNIKWLRERGQVMNYHVLF